MNIRILILLFAFFNGILAHAQTQFSVVSGTDLYISSGTIFTAAGLSLTPSTGFVFNGIYLDKAKVFTHELPNNHADLVYQFSENTNPYSGTITIYYDDAYLSFANESLLETIIYDGNSWSATSSAVNDTTNNYLVSNSISGKVLNEISISDNFNAVLPLNWVSIKAIREPNQVFVSWSTQNENNVSHFSVERSLDGKNWSIISTRVPARNLTSQQFYDLRDKDYRPERLYYRVQEFDFNGKSNYSSIVSVAADIVSSAIVVYPNPTQSTFSIQNRSSKTIANVKLLGANGQLIASWGGENTSFDVQNLPAGIYLIKLTFTDGQHQSLRLSKQ
jgi:hypothetical protein